MLQELIKSEATALSGAERHERTSTRSVQRNGHRSWTLSATAGDLELAIPKLRARLIYRRYWNAVADRPDPMCDGDEGLGDLHFRAQGRCAIEGEWVHGLVTF